MKGKLSPWLVISFNVLFVSLALNHSGDLAKVGI